MIIRDHCLPGSYHNREGWTPRCAWPEDCTVQWGGDGLVFAPDGTHAYTTAFFEAFPTEPSTFLRGEGPTVEAAEAEAFAKLERYLACPGHEFEKAGYTNGAGLCKHCRLFRSRIFEPEPEPEVPATFLGRVFSGDPAALAQVLASWAEASRHLHVPATDAGDPELFHGHGHTCGRCPWGRDGTQDRTQEEYDAHVAQTGHVGDDR